MRVFTVHAPAQPSARPAPPQLVPEGFSWAAFLFGPLWLLLKGLWLPLLGWLLLFAAVMLVPDPWRFPAGLFLALMTGWHGRDAERWQMARRGRPVSGVVVGRDEEEATLRLGATRP